MRLGFGSWGIGGKDYGPISKKKSLHLLFSAKKMGINFFDTAPLYGNGVSEKLIGELINKNSRENVIICTKGGMLPHVGFNLKQDFSIFNLFKDLTNSLKRLNTNYIDYYLIHSPPPNIDFEKIISFFNYCKNINLIKNFGVSLRSPYDLIKISRFKIDVVEFNFNLLDQRGLDFNIFNLLKKKNIKSICRTPLCFGFLSDKKIIKKNLHDDDHRKKFWSQKQFDLWNGAKKYFFKYYKQKKYSDFSQFAINFCLSYNFDYVIPGIMNENDLKKNLNASKFPKINKKILKNIYKDYKAFEKKIYITKK